MKKFSWIFALILALSIGFIGCPAGGDDDDTSSSSSSSGGPAVDTPFVPNPDVTEIAVQFGTGANQAEVLFEKGDGTSVGDVAYANGAYTYTYAPAKDGDGADITGANYGNAIGRFKVRLGENRLGDYGFSFKWKGISGDVGLSPGNITYTKNLFILASGDQDDLTPYVGDATIKTLIANTDFYTKTGNAAKELHDGAVDVPHVKGLAGYPANQLPPAEVTEPYPIATPVVLQRELTGDVWLAFYFHASNDGGSYQISDFKLIPAVGFTKIDPPAAPIAPPPDVAVIPEGFQEIVLDLTQYMTTADAVSLTVPTVEVDSGTGAITVPFTLSNQRINIPLTTEQKAKYYANVDVKDVYIQIDCEIGDEFGGVDNTNNFRYHLGVVNSTSGWNATGTIGDFPLFKFKGDAKPTAVAEAGKGIKATDANKNTTKTPSADYFIFQNRTDAAVTVKINKISLWVPSQPRFPTVSVAFTAIGNKDATVTAIDNGFQVVTTAGYESAWIYFHVTLPTGKKLSDSGTLSFTIKGTAGDNSYKTASIYAFDYEPTVEAIKALQNEATATTDPDDPSKSWYGQLKNLPNNKIGGGASSGVAGIQNSNTAYDRAAPLAIPTKVVAENNGDGVTDDNDFWIAYQCGGTAGCTYEITNLKLVAQVED